MALYETSFVFKKLEHSAGKVTLTEWRGMDILKEKITENKSNTPAQQRQKVLFAALRALAGMFGGAAEVGFPGRPRKQDPVNAFAAANAGVLAMDEDGAVMVDFPRIACSKGTLMPPEEVTVTADEEGVLTFTHATEESGYLCYDTDMLYAVLYETEKKRVQVVALNQRKDAEPKAVTLKAGWKKENLHIYVFYRRTEGKQASETVYVELSE